jgi:hypothetical protein
MFALFEYDSSEKEWEEQTIKSQTGGHEKVGDEKEGGGKENRQ